MIDPVTGLLHCNNLECHNTIENHKWARIKADGWFSQKTGEDWCPDHIPEWVHEWHLKRAQERGFHPCASCTPKGCERMPLCVQEFLRRYNMTVNKVEKWRHKDDS